MRFFATPPIDGAFARFVVIHEDFAFALPDGVSDDAGALMEPLSVGIWACRKAGVSAGDRVLVTGAGPIGLLAMQTALAFGATEVTVTDVSPQRLEHARRTGATRALAAGDDVGEVDALIECSGHPAALGAGIAAVRPAGTVVVVGMGPSAEATVPLSLIQNRELWLTGTFRYANTYPTAIALVSEGRVDLDAIVTGHFDLDDTEAALLAGRRTRRASRPSSSRETHGRRDSLALLATGEAQAAAGAARAGAAARGLGRGRGRQALGAGPRRLGLVRGRRRPRIRGVAVDRRYPSASVVKAMLALAVVRSARGRELTASERALLGPMIRVSDNAAASTVYRRVGGSGLTRLAGVAGMTRFADVGNWADAQLTAADQARLFLRIDRLAPRRHRSYLRGLLASIVGWQRWGIAPVASERGFTIMFKGGWRTRIAHQVALLERDGRRIALAVLTSGTGDAYGRATQSGIAARVLATRPARGGA